MAIRWKNKFGRELVAKFSSPEHTLAILAAVLVFFCIELIIEQWLFDNDIIVDLLGAATGALSLLLLRFAVVNSQLYRELRSSSEKLERRVSEIAHEFQTPIAILKGDLGILAMDEAAGAVDERAWVIETATATLDRLSRLVRTLLDVAKLEAPQHSLSRGDCDARALVREVYEDCLLLAEDRGIHFVCEVDGGDNDDDAAEPALVTVDRDKIKEVLLNLIGNALKYTPRGGRISIGVNGASVASGGGGGRGRIVELSVADTGCGIAPENVPHIFERFYRIPSDRVDGTGLGLYLSKQIVEAHGGTLAVESEFGHGSRFIVRLPAAPVDERRATAE